MYKSIFYNIQDEETPGVFIDGQSCYIPRYILLDVYGKALNTDLPRPEKIEEFKNVLNYLLNK